MFCRPATRQFSIGFVLVAGLLPLSRAGGQTKALKVTVGQTIEVTSSKRYCWYPTAHRLTTGEILVTMRMSPDEIHPEGEFSAYCISSDGGRTWTTRQTMGAGANVDAAYMDGSEEGLLVVGAGYDSEAPHPPGQAREFHVTLTRYLRGGQEMHQIRDAVLRLSQTAHFVPAQLFDLGTRDVSGPEKTPEVNPWGTIIEGLRGDLLMPVYYMLETDPRYRRVVLTRSTDRGRSWEESSVIAGLTPGQEPWPWMGSEGPNEIGIVRLTDKRIYALFRTGDFMGHTWSLDDGKTWAVPVSTGFKGVAPRVKRLSNGVLAATSGRPGPVSIMFSIDGTGEKWSDVTEIFSGMSTRYTDFVEVAPGKLIVFYDSVPYGWHQIPYSDRRAKNTIFGTFVDVELVK